jgi:formimidoylglutamate deiminase
VSRAFFSPLALLPGGWARDVRLEVGDDGAFSAVRPGSSPAGAAQLGPVVPGMPDVHSHAFQRAIAGRTQRRGPTADSFWTWREAMYRSLPRLGPDALEAVAAWLGVELLEGGFTRIAEFHYVHHLEDGRPPADPALLARRTLRGLREAGLGVTLLPVLYAAGGFLGAPPTPGQARFTLDLGGYLDLLDALAPELGPDVRLGVAPHSLRAVPLPMLRALLDRTPADLPVHIHVSEQVAEVEACLAAHGRRPVALLMDEAPVDGRWCLVHATHVDPDERRQIARSGATVGLCPTTEGDLGDGFFPLVEGLAEGLRFGVGTDSQVGRSAAGELRLLEYGQRLIHRARVLGLPPGEQHTGAALWRGALAGGAAALGQRVGALEAGRRADLVSLDPAHPGLVGLDGDGLLDALVLGPAEDAVDVVVVSGDVKVRGGRHLDGARIRRRAAKVMAEVWA